MHEDIHHRSCYEGVAHMRERELASPGELTHYISGGRRTTSINQSKNVRPNPQIRGDGACGPLLPDTKGNIDDNLRCPDTNQA